MPTDAAPRILVTGSHGQLGRAVLRAAASRDVEAVGVDRDELDITDLAAVRSFIAKLQPTALVNCAAYTDVDGAETDRDNAFLVNETGCRVLAEACSDAGVHLVHVSTDYVFPGTQEDGYAELDATGPITPDGQHGIDEQAIAARGRNATSRGMGTGDQAEVLQIAHHVAYRRRRQFQPGRARQGARSDRLAVGDVALYQGLEQQFGAVV